MKKEKILKLITRIFISIFVLILVITLPVIGLKQNEDFFEIYSTFVGSKSKYQGILEVWNIDTFEGGTTKKSNYVLSVAKTFEKKNKGLYILVRNLTEYECLNLLERGEKPSLFLCSYGVACELLNYIKPYSNADNLNISNNLLESGKLNGQLYGLPWCLGIYFLISTESHLKNAGIDVENLNVDLSEIALNSGYEKQNKKGSKITYSLCYGTNKYLLPNQAFSSYNKKGLVSNSEYFFNEELKNCSQYTAYSNFIAGKSVVLLGSQRDVIKMKNRESSGKCDSVVIQGLTGFSDLIQYSFLANGENQILNELAEEFSKSLLSNSSQLLLQNYGLFSVCGRESELKIADLSFKVSLDNLKVNNIFITKSEIVNLM